MTTTSSYDICVLPGDGIGIEVIDATVPLLERLAHGAGFAFRFTSHPAGALHYQATGDALPDASFAAAQAADAILFGAMGWPTIRYADGTEIAPQLDLRVRLDLYAGVRPVRAMPGAPMPLADPRARGIDLVVVRESTEGLFASTRQGRLTDDREARDTMVHHPCGIRAAARLRLPARRAPEAPRPARPGDLRRQGERVPGVGVLPRGSSTSGAAHFRTSRPTHHYVDAIGARSGPRAVGVRRAGDGEHVRRHPVRPRRGSDRRHGHGAVGRHRRRATRLFQPCHGSAPDIAGRGKANPTAMILSAAMMLDWLAAKNGNDALAEAATRLESAVDAAYATGRLKPCEFGGQDGTQAIAAAVASNL